MERAASSSVDRERRVSCAFVKAWRVVRREEGATAIPGEAEVRIGSEGGKGEGVDKRGRVRGGQKRPRKATPRRGDFDA